MQTDTHTLQIAIEGVYNLLRSCWESCWCDSSEVYFTYHFLESEFASSDHINRKTSGGLNFYRLIKDEQLDTKRR